MVCGFFVCLVLGEGTYLACTLLLEGSLPATPCCAERTIPCPGSNLLHQTLLLAHWAVSLTQCKNFFKQDVYWGEWLDYFGIYLSSALRVNVVNVLFICFGATLRAAHSWLGSGITPGEFGDSIWYWNRTWVSQAHARCLSHYTIFLALSMLLRGEFPTLASLLWGPCSAMTMQCQDSCMQRIELQSIKLSSRPLNDFCCFILF